MSLAKMMQISTITKTATLQRPKQKGPPILRTCLEENSKHSVGKRQLCKFANPWVELAGGWPPPQTETANKTIENFNNSMYDM